MEAIEGLRFLASLPLAGTGRTEGGEKTQPFNRFHSRLFTPLSKPLLLQTRTVCDRKKDSRVKKGKKEREGRCKCLVTLDCGVIGGGEEMVGGQVVEPTKQRGRQ